MIKRQYLFILCLFILANALCHAQTNQKNSADKLIGRVIPNQASQILTEIIEADHGKDVFEVTVKKNRTLLKGNNPVAIASALNWYLKYTCNAQLSWTGNQLNLPKKLPLPKNNERIIVQPNLRLMFNYCTFSYSMIWWDWNRWQREIDFMAMNGVNMPLMVVGLEGVWYNTLIKMGCTDIEARSFLTGPAYMAWQWMTNIESFAGPLPKSWINSHIVLGKQIIERELELGMKPIQQGFSGYVPNFFIEKFKEANIKQKQGWFGFGKSSQLDPLDPFFDRFGRVFLEEQAKLFGKHGYYAADPFHEGQPPQNDKKYLNAVGTAISKLFTSYDPKSVWVIQAWSIRKDIVELVPKEKLLILDLSGEKYKTTDNFWGFNFVEGNLHNFGGRTNLHGDLALIASNQYVRTRQIVNNVVGSGLFMEGIIQNPLYYDLAFEMPFHTGYVDLADWLSKYAHRRYGKPSASANKAMQILLHTAYSKGTNNVENSSIIAARPAINVKKSGPNAGFNIPYSTQKLMEALDLLLNDSLLLGKSKGYRYDIVDIQRQVLSNLGQPIQKAASIAYGAKDLVKFDFHTRNFEDLLKDVDRLTSTRSELSFDQWVADAHKWAKSEEEEKLYDYNASILLTQWGASAGYEPKIFDYAWREWSGLIGSYYLPRWKSFNQMLRESIISGKTYSEEGLPQVLGREALRANAFYSSLADWEINWIHQKKKIRKINTGKELETVAILNEKYKPLFKIYGESL